MVPILVMWHERGSHALTNLRLALAGCVNIGTDGPFDLCPAHATCMPVMEVWLNISTQYVSSYFM